MGACRARAAVVLSGAEELMAKWFLVFAGCLFACQSTPVAIDDFYPTLTDAACSRLVTCGVLRSHDECARAFRSFPPNPLRSVKAGVEMGKVKYDGDAARRCADAIAGQSCTVSSDLLRSPDECWAALRGTVDDGGACALDAECLSQLCGIGQCDPGSACCTGSCIGGRAPGSVALGGSCRGDGECRIGLRCTAGACAPLQKLGEACSGSTSCAEGLTCRDVCTALPGLGELCDGECRDIDAFCSRGKCVKLGLSGDLCGPDVECSGYYSCDATSHCVLQGGIPLGATCQARELCAGPAGLCVVPPGESTGVCKQIVSDGDACDANRVCVSPGTCNAGTHTCDPGPVCL
jgi:hypothetical protein